MKKITKAVIPAAGFGTRFLPATKSIPKGMLTIVDKPTLHYIVEEISASGIKDVLIITNSNNGCIKDYFESSLELEIFLSKNGKTDYLKILQDINSLAKITYLIQDKPKGLGHAVLCAKDFINNEPFAVLNGDDVVYNPKTPCLKQLTDQFYKFNKSVLGCQIVEHNNIVKYGAVKYKNQNGRIYEIEDLVEKPKLNEAPSDLAVLGRYIVTPEIFEYLKTQTPGAGGEIQLTDALCRMAKDSGMYAYEFEGRRYDIGDKQGFLEATTEYALRDANLSKKYSDYLHNLLEI